MTTIEAYNTIQYNRGFFNTRKEAVLTFLLRWHVVTPAKKSVCGFLARANWQEHRIRCSCTSPGPGATTHPPSLRRKNYSHMARHLLLKSCSNEQVKRQFLSLGQQFSLLCRITSITALSKEERDNEAWQFTAPSIHQPQSLLSSGIVICFFLICEMRGVELPPVRTRIKITLITPRPMFEQVLITLMATALCESTETNFCLKLGIRPIPQ